MRCLLLRLLLPALFLLPSHLVAQDELHVPALFGLTGDSAQFGKGELDAVMLAQEEWNARGGINGRRIVLDVEDTGTQQMKVVSAFKRLSEVEKAKYVLGPTWLDTFQAVLPLAEKAEVLLLTPSAEGLALRHGDPQHPMALTTYLSSEGEVHALLAALKKQGITRVVGTYTNEPFFLLMRQLVEKHAAAYGVQLLANFDFDFGTTDFNAFMVKMKALNPECILLFQTEEGTVLSFLKARRQFFSAVSLMGVHDFAGFFKDEKLRRLAGVFYYSYPRIADPGFAVKFKDRFGYEPILTHTNAYDAANMLFTALAAGKRNAAEIRDYLLSRPFDTVSFGAARFNRSGFIDKSEIGVTLISPEGTREISFLMAFKQSMQS